jgi:HipA-like C-terminal domain
VTEGQGSLENMSRDAKTQKAVIDVAPWEYDANFGSYPEGARSKDAVFPPDQLVSEIIIPKRRYLYKRSDRRYPDQFWGEVVAYQVGCLLDVTVPPAFAAINTRLGDSGALIEWFYEDGKALFTPGGSYMQKLIPEFDRKKGELHNFQYIELLCRFYSESHIIEESWIETWADIFLFDALIGNTDRHQDNWGLLRTKGQTRWTISPAFDNGTSLGHERFMEHVQNWKDEDFRRYIAKGRHHVRWQKGDDKGCEHVDLLRKISAFHPAVREQMVKKISEFDLSELQPILKLYQDFDMGIPLTEFRAEMYLRLLDLRRKMILTALS